MSFCKKDSRISRETLNISCNPDILAEFKQGILDRWKAIDQNSENNYFLVHPNLKKIP